MPDKGYEFFEHTADVGVDVHGATLEALFVHAAQALTEVIAGESRIAPTEERQMALQGDEARSLMLVWLNELLFWFSTDRFLPSTFHLDEVSERSLRGRVRGERFDPARHTHGTEVKGITRHQLRVERVVGRWEARAIFDV